MKCVEFPDNFVRYYCGTKAVAMGQPSLVVANNSRQAGSSKRSTAIVHKV
jgi:hypothetical protein